MNSRKTAVLDSGLYLLVEAQEAVTLRFTSKGDAFTGLENGKVVLGVINMPCDKQIFIAERGKGSLLNGKRIRVSNRGIREAMITFGTGKGHDKRKALGVIKRLLARVSDMRMLGSAVVHHTYIAMGKLEVYIDMKNLPWDNAAGLLLVEEAGGKATDFSGSPWNANTTQFLASNGRVHKEILRIINHS